MTQTLEPDDDFADLDAELASAMAEREANQTIEQKRKRLAKLAGTKNKEAGFEHDQLLAEIRRMEEKVVWYSVTSTALFHVQTCMTCESVHRFFQGWMTEQHHRTDKHARRLLKGRPVEDLPERIEEHNHGSVEVCSNCVESVLAINRAVKGTL